MAIGVQGCRRGMVTADDTVLVLGAGPIGLAIVEVARAHGAKVYATDLSAERLATAADLGATPIAGGDGLLERVLEITNGEGMPVVMEATGAPPAMEQTIDLVAAGGRIVILGLVKKGQGITFPGLDFTRKEVTILGSRASVDCFPGGARPARLRQDPLPEDRQLASRSARRPTSSPNSQTIQWPCTRPYSFRRTHEARYIFPSQRQATTAMPACWTAITSPA